MSVSGDQSHRTLGTIRQLRELLIGLTAPFPNTGVAPTHVEYAIAIRTL